MTTGTFLVSPVGQEKSCGGMLKFSISLLLNNCLRAKLREDVVMNR
jgi:hypothetical protein|uniref:Uncharacterized protein n=1 Tax=Zea mays TaxID=4577 RepID=B4FIA7_MAIZE|nr:unknown [Zea mays]